MAGLFAYSKKGFSASPFYIAQCSLESPLPVPETGDVVN